MTESTLTTTRSEETIETIKRGHYIAQGEVNRSLEEQLTDPGVEREGETGEIHGAVGGAMQEMASQAWTTE